MGEDWLAEQTEPGRQTVDLKIIKAGMDTTEVVARLALMEHPAIARVFQARKTPEGRPYFVMNTSTAKRSTPIATATSRTRRRWCCC
jgi:non-specific serine/threonine protein kinase/serine/threonine-protein kinase